MGIYETEVDGHRYRFEAANDEEAARLIQERVAQARPPQESRGALGALTDGINAVSDGLTFGAAMPIRSLGRAAVNWQNPADAYRDERQAQSDRRERMGVAGMGAEIGAGMLSGGGLARAGVTAARMVPQGMTGARGLAARSAAAGADAGVAGGIEAASQGENPVSGAVTGAMFGAAGNAAVEGVTGAAARAMRRNQIGQAARQTPELKADEEAFYRIADAQGAQMSPQAVQRMANDIAARLQNAEFDRDDAAAAFKVYNQLAELAQSGTGITVKRVERIVQKLGRAMRSATNDGNARYGAGEAKSAIQDVLENPQQGDMLQGSGQQQLGAYKMAREAAKARMKSEELDKVFNAAQGGYPSGDANGIRLGLRGIIRRAARDRAFRGLWSDDELEAMRQAADGGPIESIVRQIGRFGMASNQGGSNALGSMIGMGTGASIGYSMGSAMGGPVGGAIGAGLGGAATTGVATAARAASDAATMRNANLARALISGTTNLPPPSQSQRALTDEETRKILARMLAGGGVSGGGSTRREPIRLDAQ